MNHMKVKDNTHVPLTWHHKFSQAVPEKASQTKSDLVPDSNHQFTEDSGNKVMSRTTMGMQMVCTNTPTRVLFFFYVFICLKAELEKGRETEQDLPSIHSVPRWPQWPQLDQAKVRG